MPRRSARAGLMLALWLVAATGALLLGIAAVGTIGTDIAGGARPPLTDQEIDARLALPAPPSPAPAAPVTGTPSVVPAGPAGTVLARCTGSTPSVVSVNPAQGFEASDDDRGNVVRIEGDDVDVTVTLRCEGSRPAGAVAVETDD